MPKNSPLASVAATRRVLEAHGLATKKALGQHFLINDGVVARICDLAGLDGHDVVLEVGPGIGTLTLGLLARVRAVVSVERDKDLPAVLADTCSGYGDSFALVVEDALCLTESDVRSALEALPLYKREEAIPSFPQKLVSNLPYAVAATLILDFFERFPELQSATVMVQSEVADRIGAQPGSKAYGAYTVKLGLYASQVGRFKVAPSSFFPPPRVDSAVIRLDRIDQRDAEGGMLDPHIIEATAIMADAAFANRRKTVLNSCKAYFSASDGADTVSEQLPGLFEEAGIPPTLRGEVLTVEEYVRLGRAYADLILRHPRR